MGRFCRFRSYRNLVWTLALLTVSSLGFGQAQTDGAADAVHHAVAFAVSPPLRDLANLPQPPRQGFHKAVPVRPIPKRALGQIVDSVEQSTLPAGLASFSIGQSFLGLGNGFPNYSVTDAPPDANMAVGDTQIVQWVNVSLTVCDKNTTACGPAIAGNLIWSALGGVCAANNDGQPIVEWDVLAHRWLLSQNVLQSPYAVCVAVSQTPDANGSYYLYQFPVVDSGFPDYQKWGLWSVLNGVTAVELNYGQTWNNFGPGGNSFAGAVFCAYNSVKLLVGDETAEQICHQYTDTDDSLLPADVDSPLLNALNSPPAGEDQFAIGSLGAVDNANLSLYSVHINNPSDWTQGATFTGDNNSQLISIAPFTPACNGNYGGDCVPQPGTSDLLESLGDRLMARFSYQCCFGLSLKPPEQHWYVNFDVTDKGGGQNAVHWIEFTAPIKPLSAIKVFQEGTYAPDKNWRWMGSMAGDKVGDILVGYSESCGDTCPGGTPTFPSIYVAGRRPNDRPNHLEPEVMVVAGSGSQLDTSGLWGGYSSMRIDANDGLNGCIFWYTTEYYMVTEAFDWSTQIASFKFSGCSVIDTQTTVTGVPKVSSYLQPITLNASVSSNGNGTPTGTADFNDTFGQDFTPLCTGVPLDNAGNAVCTTTMLAVGTHDQIVATYNGDLEFSTSSGLDAPQLVNQAASTTSLTSTPNPSQFNQLVTFTAVVTGAFGGTPTGTVTFSDNATPLCTNVALDSSGAATCQVQTLAAGQHTNIKATYSGDQNFTASAGQESQVVNKATTTTVLTAVPPNQSTLGELVTFTAAVTGAFGGSPTGLVNFTDNGTAIAGCTGVALVPQGSGSAATCKTKSLPVGSHTIAASYNGDSNFNLSNGSIPYTVNAPGIATTTTVTSSQNPSSYLQPVTLTATVTASGGGSPTGTVEFLADGLDISGCSAVQLVPIQNGSAATCTIATLQPGGHSIVANYSGDANFSPSSGTLNPQVVNAAATTTVLTAVPPSPSSFGQSVTFTATVTGAFGGSPNGTVEFLADGVDISGCSAVQLVPQQNGSTATCTTTSLVAGSHTIAGNYSGDPEGTFNSSGGSIPYVVLKPTTTTLSVSPPPPVKAGQVVTLTAMVNSGSFGPAGSVTFLNGKQVLGIVQLVAGGSQPSTGVLMLRFSPGTYSLMAQYNGTSVYHTSLSSPQPYTVTGTEPTLTTLSATPDGSNYDFTASVFGFGFPAPTGTASFTDLTTLTNLGSVGIVGPGMSSFQPAAPFHTGAQPFFVASGDFNRDGILDLAVTNFTDGTVSVLLGNGDGTFQPQQTYGAGASPIGIVVADFNGDGFPDLVVANDVQSGTVSVLLGNGDGTFQAPQQYSAGRLAYGIAVADFNGDGLPDVVVTNASGTGTVSVLLGNGDGTFQLPQQFSVGVQPIGVAVADFNGDGIADLAVTNESIPGTVSVLLGNGDGTFKPQQTYPVGIFPYGIAVADFNGDGIADLAVTNFNDADVSVLLGKGDGTFQPQQTYPVGNSPHNIAIADFNGDGIADLAVGDGLGGTASVLLGKGDGTFQPQQTYGAGSGPLGIAAADFNGDGVPDIAAVDNSANTVSILLGGTVTTGTLLNVPVFGLKQTIQSTYTPNLNFYTGSLSNQVVVDGKQGAPTTTVISSSVNPSSYLQPVTFIATVTDNGGSPTGTVTFTANNNVISGCSAVQLTPIPNGSTATCTTATLSVPSDGIVGSYSGDSNFAPSQSPPIAQIVNPANTTTVLTAVPPGQSNQGQSVTFTATVTGAFGGSPTGTVGFTDNLIPITGCSTVKLVPQQNGSTATCTTSSLAVGSHTIAANYNGDPNFHPSSGSIPYLVNALGTTTTTTVTSSHNPSSYLQPVTFTATVTAVGGGSPTGTVTFNADQVVICNAVPLVPQSNGSTATCTIATLQPGGHNIFANYSGDSNFSPSSGTLNPPQVVNAAATTTVLTANPPGASNFGQQVTFTATVTGAFGGSPNGTVEFLVDGVDIAGCSAVQLVPQKNGSTATCTTASLDPGSHSITGSYSGDPDSLFNSSSGSIPYLVRIGTITFTSLSISPASPVAAGQVVTLTATVNSDGGGVGFGTVTFLSGTTVLGTVQLVEFQAAPQAPGTATLLTRFPPGTYSLSAQFNQTNNLAASSSGAQPYSVTGTEPTLSTLSATPDSQDYDFALSVFGYGFPALGGNGALYNLTLGGSLVGNIPLPGPGMSTFQPQQTYPTGLQPAGVAVADFNGDGILDLAVTNNDKAAGTSISVLLGSADGTFQAQQTYPVGTAPVGIVAADFNGDGIADLAITNHVDNTVSVLLGNGDGTFRPQQTYSVGKNPMGVATADFNGDGVADLAVTNENDNTVSVLLGNGDGTFQAQQTYPVGTAPDEVVTADFNGDGIADLAITNKNDNTISVLLGNGDGTFQQQRTYPVGKAPVGIAAADFNGDGFADLAIANLNDNTISVLLGKGDGTFKPQQTYTESSGPLEVTVADFNGDGIADLAITNSSGNTVGVLLGNGNGTFQPQQTYQVGHGPGFVEAGDFNGDGVPDLAVASIADNTVSILIGGTVSTGLLKNVPVYGFGKQGVQSSFTPSGSFKAPSGSFYAGSLSNTVQVVGIPQGGPTTTTVLTSSLNPSMFKQAVTFTATVTASDGSSPSGLVTFQSNGVNIPDCPKPVNLVRGIAICTTLSLAVGNDTIQASFNDPQGFYGSSAATLIQMVGGFSAQISPSSATVIQGYNNTNEPFFATSLNVTVQPLYGYNGTVMLSCNVNPTLVGGTCVVNPPSSGSLASGSLNTTLTISASSTTPIGPYTVTVTAQDASGMMQVATLALAVIDYAPPINEPPGGGGMTMVNYNGPSNVGIPNFACTAVTGTGINGSEPLSQIGGSCVFGPGPGNLPGTVKVTISGCTVARLRTRTPIYAAFFLGLPAMVLLGSVRLDRMRRKRILQVVGTLLLLLALLMGVGCGAGGSGQLTPPGMYLVLVQGTGTDGVVYSGVVPVNVSGGTTH